MEWKHNVKERSLHNDVLQQATQHGHTSSIQTPWPPVQWMILSYFLQHHFCYISLSTRPNDLCNINTILIHKTYCTLGSFCLTLSLTQYKITWEESLNEEMFGSDGPIGAFFGDNLTRLDVGKPNPSGQQHSWVSILNHTVVEKGGEP